MNPRRFLSYVAGTTALLGSLVGCKSPVGPDPVDNPPKISSFSENPALVPYQGSSKFKFKLTDDKALERVVLSYADGTSREWTPHAAVFEDSATHQELSAGPALATLTGFDGVGQKVSKDVEYAVEGNGSPAVLTTPILGVEGLESAVALKSLATDPENDPLTIQVVSATLEARIVNDSLRYKMTDPDGNGSASITLQVSDGHNAPVTGVVPVVIAARDRIAGRVHDVLEGSYISTVNPSLVMPGPFAGYVRIDGNLLTVNSDGSFSLPGKTVSKPHALEYFIHSLSHSTDSSFVARDTIVAGDNTALDLGVHTNAGTGPTPSDPPLPRWLLKAFYNEVNDLSDLGGANPEGKIIYLSAKDTTWDISNNYLALDPAMQNTIADRIQNGFLIYYEPSKRPQLVKGQPGDALLLRVVSDISGSYIIPAVNYFVGFRGTHGLGAVAMIDWDFNGETESAIVTLLYAPEKYPGGFHVATTYQEYASPFIQKDGGAFNSALYQKTCLFESEVGAADHVTGCDQKLIELVKNRAKTGRNVAKYFSL